MSSIESLKEKARRHEQKEEWAKALELYDQAIRKLEKEEQPDIGLYNRVGDLQTRLGNLDAAAEAYEEAVDLYVESGLPNNAIAVCKKVIRNMPKRNRVYLKMGQVRAQQGFLVDARANFLTYAERMQAEGEIDEALRALIEFADLAPEDLEIRLAVAGQLESNDRTDEAVEQLRTGYRQAVSSGKDEEAKAFEEKLHEIDPSVDLDELAGAGAAAGAMEAAAEEEFGGGFEEISFGGTEGEDEEEEDVGVEIEADFGFEIDSGEEDEEEVAELPGFDEEDEEEAEPLPTFGMEEDEEEAEPLPTFDDDETDEEEEEVLDAAAFGESDRSHRMRDGFVEESEMGEIEIGGLDLGEPEEEEEEDREEVAELPGFDDEDEEEAAAEALESAVEEAAFEKAVEVGEGDETPARLREARDAFADEGAIDRALEANERLIGVEPDEVEHRQRQVEFAFQSGDDDLLADAYLGLARCLERNDDAEQAQAVYQQVLSVDADNEEARAALEAAGQAPPAPAREVASSDSYVDLGGLILDEEEEEKTTRFQVAYEEPSGDEEADFAKMLSQFKQKVSENIGTDDVRARHDLGTAYKEMGLLDEAIEEFQAALRASAHHLPTYELLGQVFMEKGEYDAAVRALRRALDAPYEVEDELIGIYYHLGRAHEELGNTDQAVEFYDQVFSLDINFADVTERLRNLR